MVRLGNGIKNLNTIISCKSPIYGLYSGFYHYTATNGIIVAALRLKNYTSGVNHIILIKMSIRQTRQKQGPASIRAPAIQPVHTRCSGADTERKIWQITWIYFLGPAKIRRPKKKF